jgi:DNA-binding transcriptional MocR family regulator
MLAPRLGFIVLPKRLVDSFAAARRLVDRHPPTLDQAILAEFINDGHFGHHVRRMRQLYAERMDILKAAADKHLDGVWTSFELEQAGVPSDGSIAWLLIKKPPQGQKRWVWRFSRSPRLPDIYAATSAHTWLCRM